MTERELTGLALRLFAIYVLVELLLNLPGVFVALAGVNEWTAWMPVGLWFGAGLAGSLIVGLGITVLLWRLAGRALTGSVTTVESGQTTGLELIVLSALGLYLLLQGIGRSAFAAVAIQQSRLAAGSVGIGWEAGIGLAVPLLQALIGLSLILRSRGWAVWLRRLRDAGTPD